MTDIYSGNAQIDGMDYRGWIVGSFVPEGLRHCKTVEIKWGMHKAGEGRADWATDERRTTICILISGKLKMHFRERNVLLETAGDYLMWGEGIDHRWQSIDDSIVLTIRW